MSNFDDQSEKAIRKLIEKGLSDDQIGFGYGAKISEIKKIRRKMEREKLNQHTRN